MKQINASGSDTISSLRSLFLRIPKKWWMLFICLAFIALIIPLSFNIFEAMNQKTLLVDRISQLQMQQDDLQLKLSAQSNISPVIEQLKADIDAAELKYQHIADNPLIVKNIFSLAAKCDITITNMSVIQTSGNISGRSFQVLSYGLGFSGQIAGFENFLLLIGYKVPGCQISEIVLLPAQKAGELDKATVNIQVYCID